MRSFIETTYVIQRLVATGDKKQYTALGSGEGHFRPLDDKTTSINGLQVGNAFKITVEGDTDVAPSDRMIIATETYEVQGVKRETFGSQDFREVILIRKKD